jgi:hypothetical protein
MNFNDVVFVFTFIGGVMGGFILGCGFAKWYLIDRVKVKGQDKNGCKKN